MNRIIIAASAALSVMGASAAQPTDTIKVERLNASAPIALSSPLMIDSLDAQGKSFDHLGVLEMNRRAALPAVAVVERGASLASAPDSYSMGRLSFRIDVKSFVKDAGFIVPEGAKVYIGGNAVNGPVNLKPCSYNVEIDWLNTPSTHPVADVAMTVPAGSASKIIIADISAKAGRMPSLNDFSDGTHSGYIALSPDGRYLQTFYSVVTPGGKKTDSYSRITRTADGSPVGPLRRDIMRWMPSSPRLYGTRYADDGTTTLYAVDPESGAETILASGVPEGNLAIAPTEDFAILTTYVDGPTEGDVYQVLEPEDRQPGWRKRARLWRVDFASGITTPVTFGFRQLYLNDIADDGSKILVTTARSRYEQRPTTLRDILSIDLSTLKADTVVRNDGFVSSALFSPDGSSVLVSGTPESLDGVGLDLPEGRTASMTEGELFIVNTADDSINPITRKFDPSVTGAEWSRADGRVYFTAEDRDCVHIFVYDPAKGTISRADTGEEDMATSFSLPRKGNLMAWRGASASNSDRVYLADLKRKSSRLADDPSAERLSSLALGPCTPFNYVTSRGDSIFARYYLPADFDPAKKYPVIVNYYGGCSPTGRNFESRYPHHLYAAQGYAVLVINPSGCTGRGQEWASRHVNTAGEGVAADIIEGTQAFCRANEWADSTAIGCIGASYGGFMTQYLQTQTPMFAAAISHAGISDHTSYWGEGYWGYSYSEVSMANSYPWSHSDLYVGQSPLFLADKITTPLLFLHGDSDNNVPYGESIQMFTALKLLGRPTALVAVADQDHHILDYDKRIKWQDTIFAWFEKYLKHDSTWWDTLYPPKSL